MADHDTERVENSDGLQNSGGLDGPAEVAEKSASELENPETALGLKTRQKQYPALPMVKRVDGYNTAKYRAVQGHFYQLVNSVKEELAQVATKLLGKGMITTIDCGEATNHNLPLFDRALALLINILKKIHYDQSNFDAFVSVLLEFPVLEDTVKELEGAIVGGSENPPGELTKDIERVGGTNTAQYRAFYANLNPLMCIVEVALSQLAAMLLGKNLITLSDLENASDPQKHTSDRLRFLVAKILKKIMYDENKFDVFVSVLKEIPVLKDIAKWLEIGRMHPGEPHASESASEGIFEGCAKMQELGFEINQKDEEIKRLKKKCNAKKKIIQKLKKELELASTDRDERDELSKKLERAIADLKSAEERLLTAEAERKNAILELKHENSKREFKMEKITLLEENNKALKELKDKSKKELEDMKEEMEKKAQEEASRTERIKCEIESLKSEIESHKREIKRINHCDRCCCHCNL